MVANERHAQPNRIAYKKLRYAEIYRQRTLANHTDNSRVQLGFNQLPLRLHGVSQLDIMSPGILVYFSHRNFGTTVRRSGPAG
jgi:hypothetical protein